MDALVVHDANDPARETEVLGDLDDLILPDDDDRWPFTLL